MFVGLLLIVFADSWEQSDGPARIRWQAAHLDGAISMPFSSRLPVDLSIQSDTPIAVQLPPRLMSAPGWRELRDLPAVFEKTEDGRHRWRQRIVFEPLAPGDHLLQIDEWKYRLGDGDWRTTRWTPVAVQVTTRNAEGDIPRDITAIETRPGFSTSSGQSYWFWGVFIGASVLAGGWGLRRWLRKHRMSPRDRALGELVRLESLGLLEAGKTERYFTLLANIPRRYLQKLHAIPARRLTTSEFVAALRLSPAAADADFLAEVLRACDVAKFAPVRTSAELGREITAKIRTWLT